MTDDTDPQQPAQMSAEDQKTFFAIADAFVARANDLSAEHSPARISAAMLFATARWNAFVAQSQGLPAGEIDEDTVAYFTREYETVLRENLAQILSSRSVKGI